MSSQDSTKKSLLYLEPVAMDLAWLDPAANIKMMRDEIASRLRKNPEMASKDRIFVFPEMTLTGFISAEAKKHAIDRGGDQVALVKELARDMKTAVVFGFPERNPAGDQEDPKISDGTPWNTLVFIDPDGEEIADYRKLHLFTVGLPNERSSYMAGRNGVMLEYRGWKIALAICFDLRFPRLFQAYAREGAELVILSACWVGGPGKTYQFETLSAANAIAGQCYFLAISRSGADPNFSYAGETFVFGPCGEKIQPKPNSAAFQINERLLADARKLVIRPSDLDSYSVIHT